jgi:hypothetical protein
MSSRHFQLNSVQSQQLLLFTGEAVITLGDTEIDNMNNISQEFMYMRTEPKGFENGQDIERQSPREIKVMQLHFIVHPIFLT